MSNRLEEEFPKVAWRVSSALSAGGAPAELVRTHMERARALRRRVVRRSVRRAAAGFMGGLLAAAMFVRRARHPVFKAHARERDCWAGPAHRA
jgi:hypothetical protein